MAKKANIGAGIALDGEKEFKQAISNINSDMKVLGSELKKVSSEFIDNKSSIEALTAKDEVLNKQLETQKEKVEAVKKALENSKEQYGENDKKTKDWQITLNNAETDLNKLNKEIDDNKSAMERAKNPTENLGSEIKEVGNNADDAGKKALSMGDIIKANLISGAIISGVQNLVSKFSELASGALESADSIQQMADQTGMSAEEIQKWQYVGDTVGTSIETITSANSKLIKSMSNAEGGSKSAVAAFKELGISVTDSSGNLRNSQDVFNEAIDALGNISNETERTALAQKIFGKSASDLNPLISAGSEQLKNLAQQAKDTGAVMSDDTVSALDDFGDTISQVKTSITGIAGSILGEFTPALTNMVNKVKENAPEIQATVKNIADKVGEFIGFFVDHGSETISVIGGIAAGFVAWNVVTTIQGVVEAIKAFQLANEGATIAQYALNLAMDANPVGIVITAVTALIAIVGTLWATNKDFREGVKNIWNDITETVSVAVEKVKGFFNGVIDFVKNNWQGILLLLVNPFAGAFKLIYDNNDEFRKKVDELVSKVKGFFIDMGKSIGELPGEIKKHFDNGVQKIQEFAGNMKQKASEAAKSVLNEIGSGLSSLPGNIKTVGSDTVKALWNGITGLSSWIGKNVKGLGGDVVSSLSSGITGLAQIGLNLVQGLWNGIDNATDWILSKIKGFGGSVVNGIKDFFGIHSPSTVFRDEVGKYLAQGLGEGFVDEMDNITKDINNSIPTNFDMNGSVNMSSFSNSTNGETRAAVSGIDYNKLTDSFIAAFNIYKPQVVLDRNKVGEFVLDTVNKEVFA